MIDFGNKTPPAMAGFFVSVWFVLRPRTTRRFEQFAGAPATLLLGSLLERSKQPSRAVAVRLPCAGCLFPDISAAYFVRNIFCPADRVLFDRANEHLTQA